MLSLLECRQELASEKNDMKYQKLALYGMVKTGVVVVLSLVALSLVITVYRIPAYMCQMKWDSLITSGSPYQFRSNMMEGFS